MFYIIVIIIVFSKLERILSIDGCEENIDTGSNSKTSSTTDCSMQTEAIED